MYEPARDAAREIPRAARARGSCEGARDARRHGVERVEQRGRRDLGAGHRRRAARSPQFFVRRCARAPWQARARARPDAPARRRAVALDLLSDGRNRRRRSDGARVRGARPREAVGRRASSTAPGGMPARGARARTTDWRRPSSATAAAARAGARGASRCCCSRSAGLGRRRRAVGRRGKHDHDDAYPNLLGGIFDERPSPSSMLVSSVARGAPPPRASGARRLDARTKGPRRRPPVGAEGEAAQAPASRTARHVAALIVGRATSWRAGSVGARRRTRVGALPQSARRRAARDALRSARSPSSSFCSRLNHRPSGLARWSASRIDVGSAYAAMSDASARPSGGRGVALTVIGTKAPGLCTHVRALTRSW